MITYLYKKMVGGLVGASVGGAISAAVALIKYDMDWPEGTRPWCYGAALLGALLGGFFATQITYLLLDPPPDGGGEVIQLHKKGEKAKWRRAA